MKNLKKIASLLLALLLVLALLVPAFADDLGDNPTGDGATTSSVNKGSFADKGTITIVGATADGDYRAYRIFDLESYDESLKAYAYKVNTAWAGFFVSDAEAEDGLDYVDVDEDGYVTWKKEPAGTAADFAQLALAYAKKNNIDPIVTSADTTVDEEKKTPYYSFAETNGVFHNLNLGYYLVDSSMGALCGLTTNAPDASIIAKNQMPKIDKQVQEDSTGQWGNTNTADIGQVVHFRATITVHAGAENYVLHDTMEKGLTFNVSEDDTELNDVKDQIGPASVKVEHIRPVTNAEGQIVEQKTAVSASNYTVHTTCDDGCTFEVSFSEAMYDKENGIKPNDKLVIYYSAMVNRDAKIGVEGDENVAWVSFGEGHDSTHDMTETFTYKIDLIKADGQQNFLDGAEFLIYDAPTGGNLIKVVALMKSDVDDGVAAGSAADVQVGYRLARADEVGVNIVVTNGLVEVRGFDNGTYYLEEVEAPEGFTKLSTRQQFIISDKDLVIEYDEHGKPIPGSGVYVENLSGTVLPNTGGIGTTIFYVVGGLLVAAAVVLLVTRKRMQEEQE